MGTSDASNIPFVVAELQRLQPQSILDVGMGFGKWGVLAREYLDVWGGRCRPADWRLRLEGVEIHAPYRNPIWDGVLKLSPDFFEAYLDYSSVPWKHGVLEPKVKELIYCAFDCSATHLWLPGLKLHMRNALGYGATPLEIVEVIQIASVLGAHAFEYALPALREARNMGGA